MFGSKLKIMAAACVLFIAVATCEATLSFVGNDCVNLKANTGGNWFYWVNNSAGVDLQFTRNLLIFQAGTSTLLDVQVQFNQEQLGATSWIGYNPYGNSTLMAENNYSNFACQQTPDTNDGWQALLVADIGVR